MGAALSAFFFFLVVTLLYSHSLSVPLELGPHSNKLHLEHHGSNREEEEEREAHSSWEKKKREENAKKMRSVGEKTQKGPEGKEVIVAEESGKGRLSGEEMRRKKRTELMGRRGSWRKEGGGEWSLPDGASL